MNDSLVILPIFGLIAYLLLRTLVPWFREQIILAKAIADSGEEPPDFEEEVRKRLIKLGYLDEKDNEDE